VFTTLRVYHQSLDSALTNWTGHCDRIESTLQTFAWQQPNWNRLRQGAEILIAHFPVLRITVFPDGREWITGRFLPENLTDKQQHGVAASILAGTQFQRSLPAQNPAAGSPTAGRSRLSAQRCPGGGTVSAYLCRHPASDRHAAGPCRYGLNLDDSDVYCVWDHCFPETAIGGSGGCL
jgi:hypothetical protein